MKADTKRTYRFFYDQIKQYRLLIPVMLIGIIIAPVVNITAVYFYKEFFDALLETTQAKAETAQMLIKIILIIAGLNMIEWVFWRINEFTNNYFQPAVMKNITDYCFQYIQKHSYDFFNSNFSGSLVKKINRLANAFEGIADKFYWDLIPLFVKIIFIIIILTSTHIILGLSMVIWMILFMSFNYFFSIYKWKYDIDRAEAETKISGELVDSIVNAVNIKLFNSLAFEEKRFRLKSADWRKKATLNWNLGSLINAVQALLMVTIEFVMLYISIRLWQKGILTVGDFVIIQAFLLEIFAKIWDFGRIIRDIYQFLADAAEMIEILETPHLIKDKPHAKELKIKDGKIEFHKVSFSYEKETSVINKLSLTIKPTEKIALIGPSGGGKSTIAKLLFRFFDIDQGKILIDNQNIISVTQDSLRKNISLVPQDPILFHRTLMENIRYGRRSASDKEVIAASKMARCHEFIRKLSKGYKTYVGERGIKLSGGQRQRVAIARAILKNAPILILDEATSSLDSHSEKMIQEALQNLMKHKTTIIIAHRLSTIMKMDRIIVIEDGKIIEEGTHGQLLRREAGLYKKLWELQVGGYIGTR